MDSHLKNPFRFSLSNTVGNKVDKEESEFAPYRAVPIEEARAFAEKEGMDFVETSALTASRVEASFRRLVLSVARSLPDVKAHLELTGLPAGWMRVVTALPVPVPVPVPVPAASLSSSSTDSVPPPPPMCEAVAVSPPPSSSNSGSIKSQSSGDAEPSNGSGSGTPRSKASSRSNSVVSPEGSLFCNYWTGLIVSELPTEAAPTEMIYACNKPRLGALENKRGDESGNLSITSLAPPRAGRCFCAIL